jgi:glutathione synthase/RimK-type ligase-like ATP-grasp enzyme
MASSASVVLATSANAREMSTEDDALLDALTVLGVPAHLVNWDDPDYPWDRAGLVLIRTTWDYHVRLFEFLAWMERLNVPIYNSRDLVRWNADKRYLRELQAAGVPILPTQFLSSPEDLEQLELKTGQSYVVKPAVAAGAYETLVFEERDPLLEHAKKLLGRGTVLVQPYVDGITAEGETSLVFLDGTLHHAVRKTPKPGEFRVQHEFGGRYEVVSPRRDFAVIGDKCLAALTEVPLYARVDIVETAAGPALMELELIEPELFFLWVPEAAIHMADLLREKRDELLLL